MKKPSVRLYSLLFVGLLLASCGGGKTPSSSPSGSNSTPSSNPISSMSSSSSSSSEPVVQVEIVFHYQSDEGPQRDTKKYAIGAVAVPPASELTNYVKEGIAYSVLGWFTAEDGGTEVTDFTVGTSKTDYYAHYGQKTQVIFPENSPIGEVQDESGTVLAGEKSYETGLVLNLKLVLSTAYSRGHDLVVTYAGSALVTALVSEGIYSFSLDTSKSGTIALSATADGVSLTFSTSDLVEAVAKDGSQLSEDYPSGSNVQFKLVGKTGHEKAYMTANVDGAELLPDDDGVFTITNLTAATNVEINGYEGIDVVTKAHRAWRDSTGAVKPVKFENNDIISDGSVFLAGDAVAALKNQGYPFLNLTLTEITPVTGDRTVVMDGENWQNWFYTSTGDGFSNGKFPGEYFVNLDWSVMGSKGILMTLQDASFNNSSSSFKIHFKHVSGGDGWTNTVSTSGNMWFDEGNGEYTMTTLHGNGYKTFASPSGWLSALRDAKEDLFIGTKYIVGGSSARTAIWGNDLADKDIMDALSLSQYWTRPSDDGYYYMRFDTDDATANTLAGPGVSSIHICIDDANTIAKFRLGGAGTLPAKETLLSGTALNEGNDARTCNPLVITQVTDGFTRTTVKTEDPYLPTSWLKKAKADGYKTLSFNLALASTDANITTDSVVWYTKNAPTGVFNYAQCGLSSAITIDLENKFYAYIDDGVQLALSFRSTALGDGISYGATATFTNITLA